MRTPLQRRGKGNIRQTRHLNTLSGDRPYFLGVFVVDDVFEMVMKCVLVGGGVGDTFAKVKDQRREAAGGEIDLLVVRDLPDRTVSWCKLYGYD